MKTKTSITIALVLNAVVCMPGLTNAALPELRVNAGGHFFETKKGDPFFWIADTGWCLFQRTPAEVNLYLQNRANKRFTVIQIMAIRHEYPNHAGEVPFKSKNPLSLNETYWRHIDSIVDNAGEKGLYVVLFAMWGMDADDMFGDPQKDNYEYGFLLGQRYKEKSNVLFAVTGEYNKIRYIRQSDGTWDKNGKPANLTKSDLSLLRRVAEGLEAGHEGRRLMTIHPDGWCTSGTHFHRDTWLDFNMHQTWGTHDRQNVLTVKEDYDRTLPKPVLNGEPGYENRPQEDCSAWHLRMEAYWSVFSGAAGFTYGAHTVWQFDPGWQAALDYEGAFDMQHLRALLESRPMMNRLQDQSMIVSERGSYVDRVLTYRVAMRSANHAYAFIYTTKGESFTIDMSKISENEVNAWWYNPRDGKCYGTSGDQITSPFDCCVASGTRTFDPPAGTGEDMDWCLVLDDASQGFGTPGRAAGGMRDE